MIERIQTFLSDLILQDMSLPLGAFGLTSRIDLRDQHIDIALTLNAPPCLLAATLKDDLTQSLKTRWSDYDFQVNITSAIQSHTTQMPGSSLRQVKNTIAVASGKGGVGKSTVTVNLAAALTQAGARVGILDADIYGPSIPLMLGKANPPLVNNERYIPVYAHGIQAMSIGYLAQGGEALIWRGPMLAKALIQMLDITAWDNLDYLFIDLPPGTGDIQLSLVQKIPLTGAIIVTTPQDLAVIDAEKALKMFLRTHIDVLGIVENMSLHTCSACQHQEALFGEGGAQSLCHDHAIPLLGQLPIDSAIRSGADKGLPAALSPQAALSQPWRHIALHYLAALNKKHHRDDASSSKEKTSV